MLPAKKIFIKVSSELKGAIIMKKNILVEGMSCSHCADSVKKALCAVPGVVNVKVNLTTKTADVETDGGVPDNALKAAVADTGFQVVDIR